MKIHFTENVAAVAGAEEVEEIHLKTQSIQRLLPTPSPTINEALAESVEILEQDDPQYEALNFGNSILLEK